MHKIMTRTFNDKHWQFLFRRRPTPRSCCMVSSIPDQDQDQEMLLSEPIKHANVRSCHVLTFSISQTPLHDILSQKCMIQSDNGRILASRLNVICTRNSLSTATPPECILQSLVRIKNAHSRHSTETRNAQTATSTAISKNLTPTLSICILFLLLDRATKSLLSLVLGNLLPIGIGCPRNLHSGSHPSWTLNSSRFSFGTRLLTSL